MPSNSPLTNNSHLDLIIDMPSGVSGDMLVSALLELTGGENYLREELKKLTGRKNNLPSIPFTTQVINKQGIAARQTTFNVPQTPEWNLGKPHSGEHYHFHSHTHDRHAPHCCLKDIHHLLEHSALSLKVQEKSKKIFDILAEAESEVHGVPKERVHFHEVGSLDAIADVVSVVLLLEKLKVNRLYSSPILVGQGTVQCAHGLMPVPVPAVVKMLEKHALPVKNINHETGELSTPTGVAILAGLVDSFETPDEYTVLRSAFGAGQKEIPGLVNVLRTRLVDTSIASRHAISTEPTSTKDLENDRVWQLETNVDDMTAEALGHVSQYVMESGALDCWIESIMMKKGRPGHKLIALAETEKKTNILDKILRVTSTLGVRYFPVDRVKFKREEKSLKITGHIVRIKLAKREGRVCRWKAEAEDVAKLCQEKDISWEEAQSLILQKIPSDWRT